MTAPNTHPQLPGFTSVLRETATGDLANPPPRHFITCSDNSDRQEPYTI